MLSIMSLATGLSHAGPGHGHGGDGLRKREIMDLIHKLFDHREDIQRDYRDVDGGIEAYTYSYDEQVGSWIQEHVYQMMSLMEDGGRIRNWDDLFFEMFERRDDHEMMVANTTKITGSGHEYGVRINQTAVVDNDEKDCVAKLIQAHARVVSKFLNRGRSEMQRNHRVPEQC